MKTALAFLLFVLLAPTLMAQAAWLVAFTDKAGSTFDPHSYFDSKAIARRQQQGLPLADSTDFPVSERYVAAVSVFTDSLLHRSRWLNAIGLVTDAKRAQRIENLSFVQSVRPLGHNHMQAAGTLSDATELDHDDSVLLYWQTRRMQADSLWAKGLDGSGVRVAILDVGFKAANTSPQLAHLFEGERIVKTKNFVKERKDVWRHHSHGTMVLSCMAGKIGKQWMGLAPQAEYLLAVTDGVYFEPLGDELQWVAALEWADRNGADIINSSLGYTVQRYFPEDMDGTHSLVARACKLACRKGILVVNAAGNEGVGTWKHLSTPGDADSALTVGGINPWTDLAEDFSSVGPTADGRVKPEVVAYGTALTISKGKPVQAVGTSFASPLVAGFMACVKQHQPDSSPQQMIATVSECGHLWPYYDYLHGYGVPHGSRLFIDRDNYRPKKTFRFSMAQDSSPVQTDSLRRGLFAGKIQPQKPVVARIDPLLPHPKVKTYIHYHIARPDGRLAYYAVLESDRNKQQQLLFEENPYAVSGNILRVYYRGYTASYVFK